MRIHSRCRPELVDPAIAARVESDVAFALNSIVTVDGRFVVNDTLWFGRRPNGNVTPSVMNMAGFISGKILDTLDDRGWTQEKTILDQTIDSFIELDAPGRKFRIPPDGSFLQFFQLHFARFGAADLRKEFLRCWHNFVRVGVNDLNEVAEEFAPFFQATGTGTAQIRIGLEFETGNIASSFRALGKLETLFATENIDYGVFITSIDKANAAARIWPQSNRNGSFEELERRSYRNNLSVPLWEFGFEPDEFDQNAPYFNNKETYLPVPTGRTLEHRGAVYDVFLRGEEELLRPIIPQQNLDSDAT